MPGHASKITAFSFGPFTFVPTKQALYQGERRLKVGGRALDLLHLLVLRPGQLVTKDELIAHAWPQTIVEEANLKVQVRQLRRALADGSVGDYIATVRGRGYRFVSPVSAGAEEDPASGRQFVPDGLPRRVVLIGRERELEIVSALLSNGPLVTITGPGGIGKTAIAAEIGHRSLDRFPDGVHFIDLLSTADPLLVPHLCATTLGVHGPADRIVSAIANHVRHRRTLLILDNCEHVLPAVAILAAKLTEETHQSRFIATSREPLNVPGEEVLRVRPLPYPASQGSISGPSEALSLPSVALFSRAASESGAVIREADHDVILRLCTLLEGIPLAIGIVATRLGETDPETMLRSLSDDFEATPVGSDPSGDPLWTTLDWSHRLLSKDEAAVFSLISVFNGPFLTEDVLRMSALVGLHSDRTVVVLGRLVARSLVCVEPLSHRLGYRLLEVSRRYAAQRLMSDRAMAHAARLEHAHLTLETFERSETDWEHTDTQSWRSTFETRLGNVREALDWCFGNGGEPGLGLALTVAAVRAWNEQSSVFEQLRQVDRALGYHGASGEYLKEVVRLTLARAWSLTLSRRLGPATLQAWNDAQDLSRRLDDLELLLAVMIGTTVFLVYTGQCIVALEHLTPFAKLADPGGSRTAIIEVTRAAAFVELHLGHLVEARNKIDQVAVELRTIGGAARHLRYRGEHEVAIQSISSMALWLQGRFGEALTRAMTSVERLGDEKQALGQSHLLVMSLLPIMLWHEDLDVLHDANEILSRNIQGHNLEIWRGVNNFYDAVYRHRSGEPDRVTEIAQAIEQLERDGLLVRSSMYLGVLAEARLEIGSIDDADECVRRALSRSDDGGERLFEPELLRVKARVAHARGDVAVAVALLEQARVSAVRSGANFFLLRIEIDRVILATSHDGRKAAISRLREACARVSDDLQTPVLRRAVGLLDQGLPG